MAAVPLRPRSLSLGDEPMQELVEVTHEIVAVVKGPFYELCFAAREDDSTSASEFDDCKSLKWSEEDASTMDAASSEDASVDAASVVDLALDDEGGEGLMDFSWQWSMVNAQSWAQYQMGPTEPSKKKRSRRRSSRPEIEEIALGDPTTLMLTNLGGGASTDSVIELLREKDLFVAIDFIYVPASFKTWESVGYAIINMIDHETAVKAKELLCENSDIGASWNEPCQGLDAMIARYRNSPLMHESMPDDRRPMLFSKGQRVAFPEPTKFIKAPSFKA